MSSDGEGGGCERSTDRRCRSVRLPRCEPSVASVARPIVLSPRLRSTPRPLRDAGGKQLTSDRGQQPASPSHWSHCAVSRASARRRTHSAHASLRAHSRRYDSIRLQVADFDSNARSGTTHTQKQKKKNKKKNMVVGRGLARGDTAALKILIALDEPCG